MVFSRFFDGERKNLWMEKYVEEKPVEERNVWREEYNCIFGRS
jgi:hypothetical protein